MSDNNNNNNKSPMQSYQFASSSIQGWNDCPILPRSSTSSLNNENSNSENKTPSTLPPKRTTSVRNNRRPLYVNHIDYQNPGNSSSTSSSSLSSSNRIVPLTSSVPVNTNIPPPPRSSPTKPTKNILTTMSVQEDDLHNVKIQINEIKMAKSNLDFEQHKYHVGKISENSILKSTTNVSFLTEFLSIWNSNNKDINNSNVVNILYEFTRSNNDIAWLLSLKKLMANISE